MTTDPDAKGLVSIIVPVYNVERWLEDCLDSIKGQDYGNFEVIVVNDGSTDDTSRIAQNFAQKDKRFKVITRENGGQSMARNTGLDAAKGEFITFVDGDDLLLPQALAMLVNAINGSDFAVGGIVEGENFNQGIVNRVKRKTRILTSRDYLTHLLYQSGTWTSVCGKLYKRELFNNCRFREGLYYEDLEIDPRLCLRAQRVSMFQTPVYFYRKNPGSIIETFNEKRLDVLTVTGEFEARFQDDKILARASRNRRLAANFNILTLLEKEKPDEYEQLKQECFNMIKSRRAEALFDKHSRIKVRLGAALSFLGLFFLKKLASHYNPR